MSKLAVLTAFLLFSGHGLAQMSRGQINAANCDADSSWLWMRNSISQTPCTVSAYLESTCNGGSFSLPALTPGESYTGPIVNDDNLCKCNTVIYSLLSACGSCQGATWLPWSLYTTNCSSIYHTSSFPNPVPDGTSVPYWALIDVTAEGTWNYNKSYTVGDTPEVTAGASIKPPASTSISSSQPTDTSTQPPSSSSKSSSVGAIVGGVVGASLGISASALIFLIFMRRRRSQQGPPPAPVFDPPTQPRMGERPPPSLGDRTLVSSYLPEAPASPVRHYDPFDPTTLPWNQGTNPVPEAHSQVPSKGGAPANTQAFPPPSYYD